MKVNNFIFSVILAIFMISCTTTDIFDDGNNSDYAYNEGNTVTRNFHGLILDTSGNAVSNATVTIGSTTAQTDSKGLFILNNASVKEKFAYVKVTKTGFINGSRVLIPTTGDNRINIMLIPNNPTAAITSGTTNQVTLANGTKVKFDGAFSDASGANYTGNVLVSLYQLKASDTYLNQIMPGSLLARNTNGEAKILETYGMMHVELTGSGGQKLNIASGHTAEITMDLDASQISSSPATIPLWSFDEALGIWKEDGVATKIGNKYVGNVSHFSWWNCDAPFYQCNLTLTVQNSAGQPISNLIATIFRASPYTNASGYTNATGQVTGIIPANENLSLQIKDFCGNIIYNASLGSFSPGSSNILPTIVLSPTAISTITITGVLQTCTNTNVTNGLVKLKNLSSPNYFSQIIQPVTNGNFTFVTNICGTSQQFELVGEDYTNLQASTPLLFTATAPTTNVGIITTCNAVNEFITYQVDSNPVNYVFPPINAGVGTTPNSNGLIINSNSTTSNSFIYLNGSGVTTIGTYTTSNFTMEFSSGSGAITGVNSSVTNNIQFIVSQIGPIGGYIDLTFNGNYTNSTGNHTISGTAHVIRDN